VVAPGAKEVGKIASHVHAFSGPYEVVELIGEAVVADAEPPAPLKARLQHVFRVDSDGEPVSLDRVAFVRDLVALGAFKELYGGATLEQRNAMFRSNLSGVEKERFDARLVKAGVPLAPARARPVSTGTVGQFAEITKYDEERQTVRGLLWTQAVGSRRLVKQTAQRSVSSLSAPIWRSSRPLCSAKRRDFKGERLKMGFQ
jgi:hypothetical protein